MSGVGSVADKCQMVKECHHGEHGCIVTVNLWIAVEMRVLASVHLLYGCGWQHDQMEHYICVCWHSICCVDVVVSMIRWNTTSACVGICSSVVWCGW